MPRASRKPVQKALKSTRVDSAQLERVRRYLGAKSDAEALAKAVEHVDEARLVEQFLRDHGGRLSPADWEEIESA